MLQQEGSLSGQRDRLQEFHINENGTVKPTPDALRTFGFKNCVGCIGPTAIDRKGISKFTVCCGIQRAAVSAAEAQTCACRKTEAAT